MTYSRAIALVISLAGVAACAAPTTPLPPLDTSAIAATRTELATRSVQLHMERLARIQSLAWPIVSANADVCRPRTARRTGLFLTDARVLAATIPGLPLDALTPQTRATQVAFVVSGSPAAASGIRRGAVITHLAGQPIDPSLGAHALAARLNGALARAPVVPMTVRQPDGQVLETMVGSAPVCAVSIGTAMGDAINASASAGRIAVLGGMERALEDDLIQIVLGHELAHWLLRHPQRSTRASWMSGGVVLGGLGYGLGSALDWSLRAAGRTPAVSHARTGAALATWPYGRAFEREADYVGLYLAARAGVDERRAVALFERFAAERPAGIDFSLSHPMTAERLLVMRQTANEIAARRAAGQPLLPDGLRADPNEPR